MGRRHELLKLPLSFPSLSPVCEKKFTPLIVFKHSPLLDFSVSCFDSLNPAASLDEAGQFFCLPGYWHSPFWRCQRTEWAFRGNTRVRKKDGKSLPFFGSKPLEQLPLKLNPSCSRRLWLMSTQVRLVLTNRDAVHLLPCYARCP